VHDFRVLVVASDADVGDLYRSMLSGHESADVIWVPDVEAAHPMIPGDPPFGVIVFDVMAAADWASCQRLTGADGGPPVIVVSGFIAEDRRFRHQAFDAGCAAFLLKPCEPQTLVEAVRRVRSGERNVELL